MIPDIQDKLHEMGLSENPFRDFLPDDPRFLKAFVNRAKEVYKLDTAIEFYRNGAGANIAIIGPSRIGKTTVLQYTIMKASRLHTCIYYPYPPRFEEFVADLLQQVSGADTEAEGLRDRANALIHALSEKKGDVIVIIDNFEEMKQISSEEYDEYIRVFRRSGILYIVACTETPWTDLISGNGGLKNAFPTEIYMPPFSLKSAMEFFKARLATSRHGEHGDYYPFEEDVIRLIGIYSFFIPGRMNDLANKLVFEALTEEVLPIGEEFFKRVIFGTPTVSKYLSGLAEREIATLEAMIERGEPSSFEMLADDLDVSRVAAAGYIQRLMERGLVEQIDTPGKRRLFRLTAAFRGMLA